MVITICQPSFESCHAEVWKVYLLRWKIGQPQHPSATRKSFGVRSISLALGMCLLAAMPGGLRGQDTNESPEGIFTTRPGGRALPTVTEKDNFNFVVFGDRTSGVPAGLKVLEQAVRDTNLIAPDLVMTVGDLIQGYNQEPEWLEQMEEYRAIMEGLEVKWFPVAGNHDVYWRGEGDAPKGHHESNYEKHFAPLWYSFKHKNAGFVVLFSDEGDPATNEKGFQEARLQNMSPEQLEFLKQALENLASADHVFVFMHHPRWIGGGYRGSNWPKVHQLLKDAGNVSAVFAGHIHSMRGDGIQDGIRYQTLATTGGNLSGNIPEAGLLHHINLVRVQGKDFSIATLPVGSVIDPNKYTQEHLAAVRSVRNIAPVEISNDILLEPDKSAKGSIEYRFQNDSPFVVKIEASIDSSHIDWGVKPVKQILALEPKASGSVQFELSRDASHSSDISVPYLAVVKSYVPKGSEEPVVLPVEKMALPMQLSTVPVDFFVDGENRSLLIMNARQAVRIENKDFKLADGPFTVEGWFSPEQLSGSRAAVAKTQQSEYAIFVNEGVPQFDVHLGGKYYSAKADAPIPLNQWTHIAGVFDGESLAIFIDGQRKAKVAAKGKRTLNELPLYVGGDPDEKGAPTRPLLGRVDELRITAKPVYSENFTPERRLKPVEGTVLMLNLDKVFGPFVLDQSNSAVHATLNADAKLVPVLAP